jgi:hypothetical protein
MPNRYESPSHGLTEQLKVRVRPELFAAYTEAVGRAGTTKKEPIEKFLEQYARDHGVKIRRPKQRASPDPI